MKRQFGLSDRPCWNRCRCAGWTLGIQFHCSATTAEALVRDGVRWRSGGEQGEAQWPLSVTWPGSLTIQQCCVNRLENRSGVWARWLTVCVFVLAWKRKESIDTMTWNTCSFDSPRHGNQVLFMSEWNLSGQRDWYLHQYLCSSSAPSRPAFWKASPREISKISRFLEKDWRSWCCCNKGHYLRCQELFEEPRGTCNTRLKKLMNNWVGTKF